MVDEIVSKNANGEDYPLNNQTYQALARNITDEMLEVDHPGSEFYDHLQLYYCYLNRIIFRFKRQLIVTNKRDFSITSTDYYGNFAMNSCAIVNSFGVTVIIIRTSNSYDMSTPHYSNFFYFVQDFKPIFDQAMDKYVQNFFLNLLFRTVWGIEYIYNAYKSLKDDYKIPMLGNSSVFVMLKAYSFFDPCFNTFAFVKQENYGHTFLLTWDYYFNGKHTLYKCAHWLVIHA